MITLTIPGELTDLNKYISAMNSNRYAGNSIKRENTETVAWIAKTHKDTSLTYPVHINFIWFCKNRRKDKDNIAFGKKWILDGLVEGGILPDDGWKYVESWTDTFEVDKENPRIIVEIEPCG